MKNATFRQLRVFNEVARHLSFVRAAEALHLTPPAVTMQIKELEGHLGMALFDRTGKKIRLTTAGEYMLLYARRILATIKDAEDAAARLQRAEVGILTVGMVGTSKYFMMRMLSEFKKRHEGVDLRQGQLVLQHSADQVLGALAHGALHQHTAHRGQIQLGQHAVKSRLKVAQRVDHSAVEIDDHTTQIGQ